MGHIRASRQHKLFRRRTHFEATTKLEAAGLKEPAAGTCEIRKEDKKRPGRLAKPYQTQIPLAVIHKAPQTVVVQDMQPRKAGASSEPLMAHQESTLNLR